MIDGKEILDSLYGILEDSKQYKDIDLAVDSVANEGKRISLIKGILKKEEELDYHWRKRVLVPILESTTLVRSTRGSTGVSLGFEDDVLLILKLISDGPKTLELVDSKDDRYLYYGEFKQRLLILKQHILSGKLDEYLALRPEDMIHLVMGIGGELVRFIRIDPLKGETYRRFTSHIDLSPPSATGDGTLAEVGNTLVKSIFNKPMDGTAIGTPIKKYHDNDIAEGIPIQLPTKKQQEKTKTTYKGSIIKVYKNSRAIKTASKNDSEKSDEGKKDNSNT